MKRYRLSGGLLLEAFILWSLVIGVTVPWPVVWARSFLEEVLMFTGVSATPSQQRGADDELEGGDIWVVHLSQNTRLKLTHDGGYRSPVFVPGDKLILALKGQHLVRVPVSGGTPEKLYLIKGGMKIIGFHEKDSNKALILLEDEDEEEGRDVVGLLSLKEGQVTPLKEGQVTRMPTDESSLQHRRLLMHIKGWDRVYGNTRVYVVSEKKQGMARPLEWMDVYIQQGSENPINISRCDGINCGQPSLSHDGRQVVFIKAATP